jgi:hypothetical protein
MPAEVAVPGPSPEASPGTPRTDDSTEVTTTDCDEQSVIRSLQSAHIAESVRLPAAPSARAAVRISAGSGRLGGGRAIGLLAVGRTLAQGSS